MNDKTVMRLAGFGFWSALAKIAWGLILLNPANTFASTPSYVAMSTWATEVQWGILLLTVGIIHLATIFNSSLLARIVLQISSIAVWLFISSMFGISNPIGTGLWIYALAAVSDFIAIVYLLRFEKGDYK